MELLARRDYGRAELKGRLIGAGFEDDIAREAVNSLADEGLQDDSRFAAGFVQARAGRGTGPERIRQALREKGLATPIVERALADDGTDWMERARQVRRKKFGAELPADFPDKAKQMRFLQYRGFDIEQIEAAFRSDSD